jgi:thioredoxin reductase
VPGVYAAGDITRDAHNATWASADGVTAGTAVHRSLIG